jgi:predicted lipoprotein with Yx(FWY)xxD motif
MKKSKYFYWLSFNLLVVLSILLVACSGLPVAAAQPTAVPTQVPAAPSPVATSVPIPTAVPPAPQPQPTQAPVTLQTAKHPKLGAYLTDQNGKTLYIFTQDSHGASNCYASCATFWSPLNGTATAGSGVNASLIGSAARKDGASQVTYNGYPLYYFSQDANPNNIYGQGLQKFWYVISPAGKILKTAVTKPADEVKLVSAAATAITLALDVTKTSKYGSVLTDQNGHVLYIFSQDSGGTSACTGACATQWPPVVGPVVAGKGVNANLIGSIQRQDGSMQVTYDKHPLYEFVQDTKAGMVSGEGAQKQFYLVSPSGAVIKGALPVHTTHTTTNSIQPTPMVVPRNNVPQPMPQPMPQVPAPMGGTHY